MQSLRNLLGHLATPLLLVLALVAFTPPPALAQSAPLVLESSRQSPSAPTDVADSLGVLELGQAGLSPTTPLLQEFSSMNMRAKMMIHDVKLTQYGEELHAKPVTGNEAFGPNGESENNTYARFSPSGDLTLMITNPDLYGQYKPGQQLYVDFTPAT